MLHQLKDFVRGRIGPMVIASRPRRADLPLALWGLDVGAGGMITRRGAPLSDLVAEFGSPLHVVDGDRLVDWVARAIAEAAPGTLFADYRMIATADIGARLHSLGAGAVVASSNELECALRAGVDAERLVFTGAVPTQSSLRTAVDSGILAVAASTMRTLERALLAGAVGHPIGVGLSVRVDEGGAFDEFVGCSEELCRAVHRASEQSQANLELLRIVSDQTLRTPDEVRGFAASAAQLYGRIAAETGWHADNLMLAVDIACPTVAPLGRLDSRLNRAFASDLKAPIPGDGTDLASAVRLMRSTVESHGLEATKVGFEPGRALTASTQFLLTTILDVQAGTNVTHVVLDAGVNLAERNSYEFHQLFNVSNSTGPAERSYRLVGPICTPADVLYTNWRLPRADVGDVLAIMDTGAGFVNSSTSFSFPRPAVVVCDGDDTSVARRAETFEDIIRLDVDR